MILFEDRESATKIFIELRQNPDGGLTLSGQDIGEAPKTCFGKSDYEYAVTVPESAVPLLAMHLLAEKYRNDAEAVSGLREFCERHLVPCSFWSH